MSLSIYMKGDYEDLQPLRRRKNKAKQSQFAWEAEPAQAIPKACGFEAATRRWPAKKKGDLKKQSQFAKGLNDVSSVITKGYGVFNWQGRRENKANSKPIAGLWPEIRGSTALRDVELWIDAEGYPVAGSFKAQKKGRLLLFKFNSESERKQRYKRLGGRLVLVFDRNETDVKSKAGDHGSPKIRSFSFLNREILVDGRGLI